MERAFLYIDILGFEQLVRTRSPKVGHIFKIVNSIKAHKHFALHTVVFSDTILIFSKDPDLPVHYYFTYLIEYTQELFYRLSGYNVFFRGILTVGEFDYTEMSHIQAYSGLALIDAYHDEGDLPGFGLYVNRTLSDQVIVFDKIPVTPKFDFVLLCQSMQSLYKTTDGILPIDLNLFTETDSYARIDEELRLFREINYLQQHHPLEKVSAKYKTVYDLYKQQLPLFFEAFENNDFLPTVFAPDYLGRINPFEILAAKELGNLP